MRRVQINPFGLDWRRFVLAVDESGEMLGCGQLKPHAGAIVELASIAVEPAYRRMGIAKAIIEHLLADAPRPLYLTCRANLGDFYRRWGFEPATEDEMPRHFLRLSRIAAVFMRSNRYREGLLVMVLK